MDIIQILFIALMIALYTSQNFFCKLFSPCYPGKASNSTPVLTIYGGIVVAVVSFFFSGLRFEAQPLTIILGIFNACALYGYNYFILKGSESGPYSVLMVFAVFGGIVIPAAARWIGFDEAMTGPAMVFLAIVIIAVYLMSMKNSSKDEKDKVTPKFLLYCFGICICNGIYAAILAVQQKITGEAEKEELIIVTFITAAIFSLIMLIANKENPVKALKQTKKSAAFVLIYAISAALAVNSLVIIMLLNINIGVLMTVQNAGVMLLSVILSLIFFKEKLSKANVAGCVLMTIGLVGITVFEKTGFAEAYNMISALFR